MFVESTLGASIAVRSDEAMRSRRFGNMNVLAIDTATPDPAVSLATALGVFDEPLPTDRRASEQLLVAIGRCAERAAIRLEECDRIAVCSGPGSFTGLRIGLATAWGLGRALGAPVEGVPTLEAMAEAGRAPGVTRIAAALDAGRGEVVLQRFGLEDVRAEALAPATRIARPPASDAVFGWRLVSLPADLLAGSGGAPPGSIARALALAVARAPREVSGARPAAIYARPSAAEEKRGAP